MKTIVTLVLVMLIGGYGVAYAQQPPTETQNQTGNQDQVENQDQTEPPTQMEMEMATEMETDARDFLGLEWGAGVGVMGAFGGDTAIEKASIVTIGQGDAARRIVHVEEEGDLHPQVFLEMHVLLWGDTVSEWRRYQRAKAAYQMDTTLKKAREGQDTKDQAAEDQKRESQARESQAGGSQAGESQAGESRETQTAENADEKGQTTEWKARTWPRMPDPPTWGFGPFVALQSSDNKAVDAFTFGIMWGFRKDPKASNSVNLGVGLSFDPSVQVLAKDFKEGNAPPIGETAVRFKKEGRFGWVVMTSFTF